MQKQFLLTLAILIGMGLAIFGIRKWLHAGPGKKAFFLNFWFIALALLGCSSGQPAAGSAVADGSLNEEKGDDDPLRIKKLNSKKEWLEFKAMWKNLDALAPAANGDSSFYLMSSYLNDDNFILHYRQADSLNSLIDGLELRLYELTRENLLDTVEIHLLAETFRSRVEYIYVGFKSMITRMAPPPGLVRKESSIRALENRIDILLNLKKDNKLDPDELEIALQNVNNEIRVFGLLDVICRNPRLPYNSDLFFMSLPGRDTVDLFQKEIAGFEEERTEFLKTYDPITADDNKKAAFDAYENTHRDLGKIKNILPQFGELLKDLVLND